MPYSVKQQHQDFRQFQRYQEQCQQLMRAHLTPRFPHVDPARILTLNTPFDWHPNDNQARPLDKKIGILMVHGMFGSAFILRDLAKVFVNHGIHARGILLPGHCTRPKDLCQVDLTEYQTVLEQHIMAYSEQVDELYLLGLSFGGLLCLDYVNRHPNTQEKIKGLILISPALALRSRYAGLLPLLTKLKLPRWFAKHPETDYTRYQTCAIYAAEQVNKLIKQQAHYSTMHLPDKILLGASLDDEVIKTEAIINFFNTLQLKNPHSAPELILYGAENQHYAREPIIYRNSYFPKEKILNASHISLMNSPENDHYGRNGTADNILHKARFSFGKKDIAYGALTQQNLKKHHLYRASYNPDFDFFARQITSFILSEHSSKSHYLTK